MVGLVAVERCIGKPFFTLLFTHRGQISYLFYLFTNFIRLITVWIFSFMGISLLNGLMFYSSCDRSLRYSRTAVIAGLLAFVMCCSFLFFFSSPLFGKITPGDCCYNEGPGWPPSAWTLLSCSKHESGYFS